MSSKKKFDFEESITSLSAIVEKMEEGGLNLEESLKQFEKGIKLTRQCQTALKDAEQKVQILTQKNGSEILSTYNSNKSDG